MVASAVDATVVRLSGPDRVTTAEKVAAQRWGDAAASRVVLVRSDVAADAVAATPLAGRGGPVLLSGQDRISESTLGELRRVLADGGIVYLAGGEAALSAAVEQQVRGAGLAVQRLAGPSRTSTAVALANETSTAPPVIYVADGNTFADALVAGRAAAADDGVLVLSSGHTLDSATTAYLERHSDVPVIGVGAAAHAALGSRAARTYVGGDVFATSAMVAAEQFPDAHSIGVASGEDFPDGLSGGAHAARLNMPLLLSRRDAVPGPVNDYVRSISPSVIYLYGGTAALADTVADQLSDPSRPSATPPTTPPPPGAEPGPLSLGSATVVGSGWLTSAGDAHTYWTERTNPDGYCFDGPFERVVVQDAQGTRRTTSFPGQTYADTFVELSPTGTQAIVEGFCDDGYHLKGVVDVTADGDLVNYRAMGSGSYEESSLRWRSDGFLYFIEDLGGWDGPADQQLRLVNPSNGQTAVLLDLPVGRSFGLIGHSPDLIVVSEWASGGENVYLYDGNGGFIDDYRVNDGYTTLSPSGDMLVFLPFNDLDPLQAYRTSDLRAGTAQAVATLDPGRQPGGWQWSVNGLFTTTVRHSDSETVLYVWDVARNQSARLDLRTDPLNCQSLRPLTFAQNDAGIYLASEAGCSRHLHDTLVVPIAR